MKILYSSDNSRQLGCAVFSSMFDQSVMPPMLLGIAQGLHVSLIQVVPVTAAYYLSYGLMQPFWGLLANRLGLARTIRISIFFSAVATMFTCAANSIVMLILLRIVSGGLLSATIPAGLTYAGSNDRKENVQRDISGLMVATSLGMATSAIASGVFSYLFGWRSVFFLSSLIGFAVSLSLSNLEELPTVPMRSPWIKPLVSLFKNRAFLLLLFITFIEGAGLLGTLTFLPTFAESSGQNRIVASSLPTIYSVSVLLISIQFRKLKSLNYAPRAIFIGSFLGSVGCMIISYSHYLPLMILSCSLIGSCTAIAHSTLQTWSTQFSVQNRAMAVSLFASALFIGNAFASGVAHGEVAQHSFEPMLFRSSIFLLVVGIVGMNFRLSWERSQLLEKSNYDKNNE